MILMILVPVAAFKATLATLLFWVGWKIFMSRKPLKPGDYGVFFGIAFIAIFVFDFRQWTLSPV